MNTLQQAAPATTLPELLVCARSGNKVHISNDHQRTRCNLDCSAWSTETHSDYGSDPCARCGSAADYAQIGDVLRQAEAAYEAKRLADNAAFTRQHNAERQVAQDIQAVIANALREHGYEVLLEKLPYGFRTFVCSETEYAPVGFQVSIVEATKIAGSVRASVK